MDANDFKEIGDGENDPLGEVKRGTPVRPTHEQQQEREDFAFEMLCRRLYKWH